ncbi:kinase [Occultella glacieicola]|uniref:Kinase n=1 Tax=Occultella glacieicola TaxID=2518684 RepID=A0ABY2E7R2_9MICO|nr:kinase [Occultella glacieicola]TDE93916.1 kinase [Occultella glacieicola]
MARSIRQARPRGVAIIGHDVLRREILHVRDRPGALSVPYIDMSARFALDHGLDVVIEGILHAEIYGEMLTQLRADHLGLTRAYYYELELGETLRRHRTKPLAVEVTEEQVTSWYVAGDRIDDLGEVIFDAGHSEHAALRKVLADVGWSAPGRRVP